MARRILLLAIVATGFLLAAGSVADRGATWVSAACLVAGICCGGIAAAASWRLPLRP